MYGHIAGRKHGQPRPDELGNMSCAHKGENGPIDNEAAHSRRRHPITPFSSPSQARAARFLSIKPYSGQNATVKPSVWVLTSTTRFNYPVWNCLPSSNTLFFERCSIEASIFVAQQLVRGIATAPFTFSCHSTYLFVYFPGFAIGQNRQTKSLLFHFRYYLTLYSFCLGASRVPVDPACVHPIFICRMPCAVFASFSTAHRRQNR